MALQSITKIIFQKSTEKFCDSLFLEAKHAMTTKHIHCVNGWTDHIEVFLIK